MEGAVINVGSDKQLFIGPWAEDGRDDYLVESMNNVTMSMNEAHVTGEPILTVDKPWEGHSLNGGPVVLKDGDLFRMYYQVLAKEDIWREPYGRISCYAESTDGRHWDKPALGRWEWDGSRENNIIFPNDDLKYVFCQSGVTSVFVDPNARGSDERYKMTVKFKPVTGYDPEKVPMLDKGLYAAVSDDAIRWTLMDARRIPTAHGDRGFSCFWDEQKGMYVAYSGLKRLVNSYREGFDPQSGAPISELTDSIMRRSVSIMFSNDLVEWTADDHEVFGPDDVDNVGMPAGSGRLSFYSGNVGKYREAPGVYLAFPPVLYHWKKVMGRRGGENREVEFPATTDTRLVISRDGIRWSRPPGRKPFIRLGPEGSFWSRAIWPGDQAVRVGDELWFYFRGSTVSHNGEDWETQSARDAVTIAVLRLDGFISADAAYTGGELTTRAMIFSGGRLQLNVDTSAGGSVKVEIQDEAGEAINGFSQADGDEINGNSIRFPVTWHGREDVNSLAGRRVRLRFVMRDAKLYSFQFLP